MSSALAVKCALLPAVLLLFAGVRAQDQPTQSAEASHTVKHVTHHVDYKVTASHDPAEPKEKAAVDSVNARRAADAAQTAAEVAGNASTHVIDIANHARSALGDTWSALREARAESGALNTDQRESLKRAESNVRMAARTDQATDEQSVRTETIDHSELRNRLDRLKSADADCNDLCQMRKELRQLEQRVDRAEGSSSGSATSKRIGEMDELIQKLETEEKEKGVSGASHDDLKSEVEKLRESIERLEARQGAGRGAVSTAVASADPQDRGHIEYQIPEAREAVGERLEDAAAGGDRYAVSGHSMEYRVGDMNGVQRTSISSSSASSSPAIDVDTEMPYGELEPFGREDTAQELTESSIRESDSMVDQLERAEVAEEKRAVFRALTRLRGAAITSFDGVARSQTGNIDEYNKIHKWRNTHPLHHLADEESDISKWAFPDNADF